MERAAAEWAGHRPEVAAAAFPREALAGPPSPEPFALAAQLSYHPDRSGDVYLVAQPYTYPGGKLSSGTTHGTPHAYDTHAVFLVYGPGVAGGRRDEKVTPLHAAAITADFLGVNPPRHNRYALPTTLAKP